MSDWHDPESMYRHWEKQLTADELREALIISADSAVHLERIRTVEEMGATQVALMNVSGADPHAAIDFYRDSILPELG